MLPGAQVQSGARGTRHINWLAVASSANDFVSLRLGFPTQQMKRWQCLPPGTLPRTEFMHVKGRGQGWHMTGAGQCERMKDLGAESGPGSLTYSIHSARTPGPHFILRGPAPAPKTLPGHQKQRTLAGQSEKQFSGPG